MKIKDLNISFQIIIINVILFNIYFFAWIFNYLLLGYKLVVNYVFYLKNSDL